MGRKANEESTEVMRNDRYMIVFEYNGGTSTVSIKANSEGEAVEIALRERYVPTGATITDVEPHPYNRARVFEDYHRQQRETVNVWTKDKQGQSYIDHQESKYLRRADV